MILYYDFKVIQHIWMVFVGPEHESYITTETVTLWYFFTGMKYYIEVISDMLHIVIILETVITK